MTIDRVDISIAVNDGGPPRAMRSGRTAFGGRMDCSDGHVITVTPQPHQWAGLIRAMGDPDWAFDEAGQPLDRMKLGAEAEARDRRMVGAGARAMRSTAPCRWRARRRGRCCARRR